MKYRNNLPLEVFAKYDLQKQKQYLFLILKEIEKSDTSSFANLKQDFLDLLKISPFIDAKLESDIGIASNKETLINSTFEHFKELFQAEKDFHFLQANTNINIKTQDSHCHKTIHPLILILHNLRSAFNVGAIIRTAECFGIEKLIFSGYTALPTHPKVMNTAMHTHNKIAWEQTPCIKSTISSYSDKGYTSYALETAEPSVSLFTHQFQQKNLIIVGNEALGIEADILTLVDHIIQIPLFGWKNSLNVGTATALAIYEIIKQIQPSSMEWESEQVNKWTSEQVGSVPLSVSEISNKISKHSIYS